MSDSWNGSLEAKINTVIDGLGAYDSSFLCEHFEASEATSGLIIFDGLEVLAIDNDLAWDVLWALAFESLHLANDHFSVLANSVILDLLEKFFVSLSASDENLAFHKFNESLYKPI